MRRRSLTPNIFHKLLLTLLVVALLPLAGAWYVASTQVRRDTHAGIADHLMATVDGIAVGITSWDDANVRALRQSARLADIVGMEPEKQTPILRAMGASYEWAFVVFTIGPNGENLARSDDKPLVKFGERSYFQAVMKGESVARQVLISKSTGKPALTVGVPIRNVQGQPTGVLAMAMKLDDISKVIKGTRIGATGYAILLDADNKVIASGQPNVDRSAVQDLADYPALKVDGIASAPTVYTTNDKTVVGYARKLAQGWTLLVEQDYAEAYAPLARVEYDARLLMLLTATLVVALAYWLGRRTTGPISRLIAVTELLSRGQFSDNIPETDRGDEIGALARAIERLGVSIRMARDGLRRQA